MKQSELGVAFRSPIDEWIPFSTPMKLTFTTRNTSSKGCSSKNPPAPIPALLKSNVHPAAGRGAEFRFKSHEAVCIYHNA